MNGGAGDDTFYAEDLDNADHITCGSGYDVAFVDGASEIADWGTDGSTTSCEPVVCNEALASIAGRAAAPTTGAAALSAGGVRRPKHSRAADLRS